MKIADLKQPYRRMAEYYRIVERSELTGRIEIYIPNEFPEPEFNHWFWTEIKKGNNPPITEEIKKHFPPDFDFSGEDIKTKPVMQMLDAETQKYIYTQLAKEGKFDELPDTCEFSEPINLQVWDNELMEPVDTYVLGKFKGLYITEANLCWQYAKLPTPKIDFLQFKAGDVVEVELSNEEKRIGWFDYADRNQVVIKTLQRKGNQVCNGGSCSGSKMFNLEKIKLITKIK